jgi:hypothetical protein
MRRRRLTVHLEYGPKPIPTTAFDWSGAIDGEEERMSVAGPTPAACLRELADMLEEESDDRCIL